VPRLKSQSEPLLEGYLSLVRRVIGLSSTLVWGFIALAFDPASSLKEIRSLLAGRKYYNSAKIMFGLVRADGHLKPVGGYAILSDKLPEHTHSIDYGTLVLLETSLALKAFDEWLTKLVGDGNASVAGFEIPAKGDFEPVTWPYERFMPSDFEYFPVEWGCDFYKFKFSSQVSVPGPLPVKPDLPLYPDGPTAWSQWMKTEPARIDLPGHFFFLFPNMDARIDKVVLTSKNVRISLVQGKGDWSSLKGKLFVQEAYTGSYRPSTNSDLTFPQGLVEVPLSFRPGFIYVTLSSKAGELVDLRRSYLNYPAGQGLQFELTSDEVEKIIDQGENETTEFKVDIPKNHMEFAETMVAFSNHRGGLILLGIDDHGEVRGLQEADIVRIEERIRNFSREFCDPPVKFVLKKIELQGKFAVVVEIPEGSAKPYWLKNRGPMIRSGSTDRVMSRIEAQQAFSTVKGPFG
jgi:hypothetical protein